MYSQVPRQYADHNSDLAVDLNECRRGPVKLYHAKGPIMKLLIVGDFLSHRLAGKLYLNQKKAKEVF